MRAASLSVSAGGILLVALLCFFFDCETLCALLLPVAVHELAHVATLRLMGLRVRRFRAELRGFCIEYSGCCGALGHALAAGAGPAAGLLYALAASYLAARLDSRWLSISAGFSVLLSLFNLLPALPLDGGRILENILCAVLGQRTGQSIVRVMGLVICFLLLAAGMWIMLSGGGVAAALAAVWLLMWQDSGHGIVKLREVL